MLIKLAIGGMAALGVVAWAWFGPGAEPAPPAPPSMPAAAPAAPAPAAPSASPGALGPDAAEPVRIPARQLDCVLGRITNFDASRVQTAAEYRFEGKHPFRMALAATTARSGPPPSALAAPEPVDPQTRILVDPDGLARGAIAKPFHRVIDLWPERVEMVTPIGDDWSNLIILTDFSPSNGTVNLFMTAARDGMTFDFERLYAGPCTVALTRTP